MIIRRRNIKMEKGGEKGLLTIIGVGTILEGTIVVPHSIRIDGTLKGKLVTHETLTVGSASSIEADIIAKNAIIGGNVHGNLTVEDRVEIEENASFVGDLKTKELIINEGAKFHGNCSMNSIKNEKN
jgi:cytoskeletal protein CcmA (bactofilin family)